MKKIILTIVLIAFSSGLIAQDTAKDAVKEEDIRQLLNLTGSGDLGMQMMDQFINVYNQSFPDIPQEFWTEFRKEIDMNELVDLIVPVYDKHYTHDDIKQLIAFYETPVGKKSIKVLPQITEESMFVGQQWGAKIGEKVAQKLEERENSKK